MAKEDIVRRWIEQVNEDIGSAECLFQGGHFLYVGFLCHQAIEKMLKAYYMATHDDDPRYTHSHMRLLEDCGLISEISDEQMRFTDFMVPMYIKARYPEKKEEGARMLGKGICQHMIKETKELTQWIEEKLSAATRPSASSDATSK